MERVTEELQAEVETVKAASFPMPPMEAPRVQTRLGQHRYPRGSLAGADGLPCLGVCRTCCSLSWMRSISGSHHRRNAACDRSPQAGQPSTFIKGLPLCMQLYVIGDIYCDGIL
jgi:hypothetical protein